MPKFRFELEAVIKQRLAIERQKQLVLADLERMRLVLEDKLRGFQASITAEKNDLRETLAPASQPGAASVDLRHVRMQANMSLHLVAKAQQAVFQLAGRPYTFDPTTGSGSSMIVSPPARGSRRWTCATSAPRSASVKRA